MSDQTTRALPVRIEQVIQALKPYNPERVIVFGSYAWGKADAFNPMDQINPRDYLDVLENEKIGVVSASVT
ncbi:MAG TPA: hypothetical protein EYP04_12320, partial [Anaerolineae bacterium]|nr:hypothetical protein [Anaerolineae bacterium]